MPRRFTGGLPRWLLADAGAESEAAPVSADENIGVADDSTLSAHGNNPPRHEASPLELPTSGSSDLNDDQIAALASGLVEAKQEEVVEEVAQVDALAGGAIFEEEEEEEEVDEVEEETETEESHSAEVSQLTDDETAEVEEGRAANRAEAEADAAHESAEHHAALELHDEEHAAGTSEHDMNITKEPTARKKRNAPALGTSLSTISSPLPLPRISPRTTSSCCPEKPALLAAQAAHPRLAKNFRASPRASAAIRASVSSAPSAAVDVIAAAIIAVAVPTAAEDAPIVVAAVRNAAAAADARASGSSAVPAVQAVRVMIAGTREAMGITPALRAARNSFPKCSRLVRM